MTVWYKIESTDLGTGSEQQDGKFVPITPDQHELLRIATMHEMAEGAKTDAEYGHDHDPQYYLERLEATHFFISVHVPEHDEGDIIDGPDTTWWDFAMMIAKQVDGDWYVWSEDPGDYQNIWYQSTYERHEAYAVRDCCIDWAERGCLYNDPMVVDDRFSSLDYVVHVGLTHNFYEYLRANVMKFW